MTRDQDVAELQQAVARIDAESGAQWREQWKRNERTDDVIKDLAARTTTTEIAVMRMTTTSEAMQKAAERVKWWVMLFVSIGIAILKFWR